MTVMRTDVYLRCDGIVEEKDQKPQPCISGITIAAGTRFQRLPVSDDPVAQARAYLQQAYGWQFIGGKDFCDECVRRQCRPAKRRSNASRGVWLSDR